jgi:hypothetical protein
VTSTAANLRAGTYTANIVISGSPPSTPVTIPVSLTVGEGLVRPADIALTIDAATEPASPLLRGSVPIELSGGPAAAWTARSNFDLVRLTRNAGETGTSLDYEIDLDRLADIPSFSGDGVATVTITPDSPVLTPVSFDVRLTKRVAQIERLAPYYQLAGQSARIVVRGQGFVATRDWSTHFLISTPGATVTRVNDTELLIDLPPPIHGGVVFEATNALGLATAAWTLPVLQPTSYSDAQIPTGFAIRSLEYDVGRQRLYAVDADAGQIVRYAFAFGSWDTGTPVAVPGITDASLSLDGERVHATATPGTLHFFDADTFHEGSLPIPQGVMARTAGRNIVETSEGNLWIGLGSGAVKQLGYFDGRIGELSVVESPLLQLIGGPWFAASPNGERLLISQSSNATPAPAMLYLDAANGELREAPMTGNGERHFDRAAMSEDASRMILNGYQVRDAGFTQLGHVNVQHDNFMSVGAAVTRDGSRAYVVAYEANEFHEPTPQFLPRVYVFDLEGSTAGTSRLPILGYFELDAYPTCLRSADCEVSPHVVINPEGTTLFVGGNERILVAAIPAEATLTPAAVAPGGRLSKGGVRTTPWVLSTGKRPQ